MPRSVPLVVFLLALTASVPSRGGEDDAPVTTRIPFEDPVPDLRDAYGLYDGREKVGYGRQTLTRSVEGDVVRYVGTSRFLAEIRTLGSRGRLDFESTDTFDGHPPYALVGAVESSFDGEADQDVRVEGAGEGAAYVARVTREGERLAPRRLEFDYSLIDRLTHVEWIRREPAVGDSIRVREFNITDLEEEVYTYTVLERGWLVPSAVHVEALRVSMHSNRRGDLGDAWMDVEGRLLTMRIASRLEVRLETEAQAMRADCPSALFAFGRVPTAEKLGEPRNVKRLVVAAYGREARTWLGGALAGLPRVRVLEVSERGDPVIEVVAGGAGQAASTAPTPDDDLASTTAYPAESAEVLRIVQDVVGERMAPRERVGRLLTFVSRFLHDVHAPYEPSVHELLRVESLGDETEHARLFVTLARAAGVPAREVHGLVYLGDDVQAFGPHRWCEVLLAGRWEEVDPTWEQLRVDATHLPLARGARDSTDLYRRTQGMVFELREVAR